MTELTHFGIKGMKWGVRRAEKAQARINKHISEGMSVDEATAAEAERKAHNRKLIIAGIAIVALYAPTVLAYSRVGAQKAANNYVAKKTTQAGARATANLLADSRGLSSQKIVDLGFDAVSGKWR